MMTFSGTFLLVGLAVGCGFSTEARAQRGTPESSPHSYVDVTFLLDNSTSMLLAFTLAGVSTMEALTLGVRQSRLAPNSSIFGLQGLQCAWAGHWSATNHDSYGLARTAGVQLRFDAAKAAVQSAIARMSATEQNTGIANQFGTSIYPILFTA
jgi:hypothetical protein